MNKEQQGLLDEVYKNYWGKVSVNNEEDCLVKQEEGSLLKEVRVLYQQEFINKCKTDPEFSEKWGLTIEERELNLDERAKLHPNPENFYNIHGTFSISDSIEDSNFPDKDWLHEKFDNGGIPTKLITINYNDKKIESYE